MNLEKLFEESYVRVIGRGIGINTRGEIFFKRFYEIFLASSTEVETKFKGVNMAEQVRVLEKGVFQLISFYLLKTDGDYLQSIALSHSKAGYDIAPALYDLWLTSLVTTVAELDPEYNSLTGLAWQIVMTPGIMYLKYHHDANAIFA